MTAPTRTEIDQVIAEYGDTERYELPQWLLEPKSEHEFGLALSLVVHQDHTGKPVYDARDNLIGWRRTQGNNSTHSARDKETGA